MGINKMRKKEIKSHGQMGKDMYGTQRMIIPSTENFWYEPQIKLDFKRTQ